MKDLLKPIPEAICNSEEFLEAVKRWININTIQIRLTDIYIRKQNEARENRNTDT